MGVKWLPVGLAGLSFSITLTAGAVQAQIPGEEPLTPTLLVDLFQTIAHWLLAVGILLGTLVIAAGIGQYQQQRRWQRRQYARTMVSHFTDKAAVQQVLQILDYEEYRNFQLTLPSGQSLSFEATDPRLRRALRSHDQMVKTHRGLNQLHSNPPSALDPDLAAAIDRYRQEEFAIELTLRDWFDTFLRGLEHFDAMISAGLVRRQDLQPYLLYWIQIISDRRFRRQGGSSFYDQLAHYIEWAGYSGVQSLVQRFGYKLISPPYSAHDFSNFDQAGPYDANRALCLAKAAYLIYQDYDYTTDIVCHWLTSRRDHGWQQMSDQDYALAVVRAWQDEAHATQQAEALIKDDFQYFDMPASDTQALLFRKERQIILAFRGTQQMQDWQTNLNLQLQPFQVQSEHPVKLPEGRVHRGFQEAWASVEGAIVAQIRQWYSPDSSRLWVTGHSLGGALASLAAVSLECQGFRVSGVYTYGQPRVADWQFVRQVNTMMGDRIFRYVNNNDIVSLIPPEFVPWQPTRRYGHMGQFRYFDRRGKLHVLSAPLQRWPDRILGFIDGFNQAGIDLIADHILERYVSYLQRARARELEAVKAAAKWATLTQK